MVALLSSSATAAIYVWDDDSDDHDFATAINWDPAGPPGSVDRAIFDSDFLVDTVNVFVDTQIDDMWVILDAVVDLSISGTMTLDISLGLVVGETSGDDSTLNLQAGTLSNSGYAIIGDLSGSQGEVTVDDSTWTNSDDLYVGNYGTGTLTITGGGQVSNTYAHVGSELGSNGAVTVSGTDGGGNASTWTNSGPLYVGGNDLAAGGTATVTVEDNASLTVDDTLKIWGPGSVILDGGIISTNAVEVEGKLIGNGSINLMSGPMVVTNLGIVAPGSSAGIITIDGSVSAGDAYVQEASGLLSIEIGGTSPTQYDRLAIEGASAALDGFLEVVLIDPLGGSNIFAPSVGDRFDILSADGGFGGTEFMDLFVPTLPGLAWSIDYGPAIVSLEIFLDADFDHDGDVDGGDFLVWQRGFGASIPKHADGDADNDGDVDGDDLALWRLSFGSIAPAVPANSAVPEPGSFLLLAFGMALAATRRKHSGLE